MELVSYESSFVPFNFVTFLYSCLVTLSDEEHVDDSKSGKDVVNKGG
jgi:hypothetical protein